MTNLTRSVHYSAALVLTAMIAISALPIGSAQIADPSASVTIADTPAPIGPGNSTVLTGTVSNDNGQLGATVTLSFTAPTGWTIVLDPNSAFPLAAGASAPFTLTVTAPATDIPTDGALAVTAAAEDQAGRTSTSAPASVTLTFAPLPPPPVIPWFQTAAGITGIILVILLIAGTTTYILWRRRNTRLATERAAAAHAAYLARETGIQIHLASEPLQYGHKREIMYRLSVKNTSDRPRVGIAHVTQITNGWRASLQFNKIPLSPGETRDVTLVVTPDAVITPGDQADVTISARPEEAQDKSETLQLHVTAPKAGVPHDPHYRIVTVHREGANLGIKR